VSSQALYNCKESKVKNTAFIYENANQSVEFRILNGGDYLEYNSSTKAVFLLKNIETKDFTVRGAGISMTESNHGIVITKIKIPSNYLETDTLKIRIR
jgi:hypothetical protein